VLRQFKPRILCVDDDANVCLLVDAALATEGAYLVETETDPFQVVSRARSFVPDVFILDVCMPGMDGFAVAKLIRQEPELRGRPIIYFTGMDEADFRARVVSDGPTHFLKKGSALTEILGLVGEVAADCSAQFNSGHSSVGSGTRRVPSRQ
jgi:CheY-like chemotaxis protein